MQWHSDYRCSPSDCTSFVILSYDFLSFNCFCSCPLQNPPFWLQCMQHERLPLLQRYCMLLLLASTALMHFMMSTPSSNCKNSISKHMQNIMQQQSSIHWCILIPQLGSKILLCKLPALHATSFHELTLTVQQYSFCFPSHELEHVDVHCTAASLYTSIPVYHRTWLSWLLPLIPWFWCDCKSYLGHAASCLSTRG